MKENGNALIKELGAVALALTFASRCFFFIFIFFNVLHRTRQVHVVESFGVSLLSSACGGGSEVGLLHETQTKNRLLGNNVNVFAESLFSCTGCAGHTIPCNRKRITHETAVNCVRGALEFRQQGWGEKEGEGGREIRALLRD